MPAAYDSPSGQGLLSGTVHPYSFPSLDIRGSWLLSRTPDPGQDKKKGTN